MVRYSCKANKKTKNRKRLIGLVQLEKKEYDLIGILDNEEDMLSSFENDYTGSSMYVCDLISEVADSYIPIYYNDIWEHARDISDYIEEAQAQGLAEGVEDLQKLFQCGYYQYYTESLYKNLDTIAYNMVVDKINEHLGTLTESVIDNIDFGELESKIEELTKDYDNNNRISDIEDEVETLIEEIKDGEYNILDDEELEEDED